MKAALVFGISLSGLLLAQDKSPLVWAPKPASLPRYGAPHRPHTKLADLPKASGLLDLKIMAVSRLMLDNFPHVKAYWVMLGIKTAQLALSFGADDIDGTVVHEKIYHDAGSDSPQELTVAELRRLLEEAGRIPVERDTLYHEVVRQEQEWRSGRPLKLVV